MYCPRHIDSFVLSARSKNDRHHPSVLLPLGRAACIHCLWARRFRRSFSMLCTSCGAAAMASSRNARHHPSVRSVSLWQRVQSPSFGVGGMVPLARTIASETKRAACSGGSNLVGGPNLTFHLARSRYWVELIFRWIKIGLAFSRLVDQKRNWREQYTPGTASPNRSG